MKKTLASIMMLLLLLACQLFAQNVEITDTANYWDGNWIVVGLIKNNGSTAIRYVELQLVGKDQNGTLVHTDTTYAFSPIPPGSEIPFSFLTSKSDAEDIARYGVSLIDYSQGGTGTFNFKFSQLSITERNSTFHKYSGTITNSSGSTRQYVEIALMGFNESDELVFFDTTYPNRSTLPNNGESIFDFLIPPDRSNLIDSYRIIAYAN